MTDNEERLEKENKELKEQVKELTLELNGYKTASNVDPEVHVDNVLLHDENQQLKEEIQRLKEEFKTFKR